MAGSTNISSVILALLAGCSAAVDFSGNSRTSSDATRQETSGASPNESEDTPTPLESTMPSVLPEQTPSPAELPNQTPASGERSKSFILEQSVRPLRVLIVVDNSSSMTDSVAAVRSNLLSFLTYLEGKTATKLAVLSDLETYVADDDYHQELGLAPDVMSRIFPVQQAVTSNNPLFLTALALCSASESGLPEFGGEQRICGQEYIRFTEDADLARTAGKLKPFFDEDPNAAIAMVFVTDDDAEVITADAFASIVKARYPGRIIRMFDFSGHEGLEYEDVVNGNDGRCTMSRVGTQYHKLSAAFGGSSYSVCGDWAAQFDAIAKRSASLAKSAYTLEPNGGVAAIKSVTLGGGLLSPGSYRIEEGRILHVDLAPEATGELTVTYTVSSP